MRLSSLILLAVAGLLLGACSSPDSRIAKNQAAFDRYPSTVQQKIKLGQVAIGFTPEMVRLALGEPDRVFTRRTEKSADEVWAYRDHGPRFSFGLGVSSGGARSGMGGGVGMSTGDSVAEEKMLIEFRDGKVAGIEELKK